MTFLQLKKIFGEKLKGKYVLFGNPDDAASTNAYWMRMNGIEGANVVGGHEETDSTVARKLEMIMQKIQSKEFTVYDSEIAVRKAAEQNQEKKALEQENDEEVYDGTEVQESPAAPSLNEISESQKNKESGLPVDDQEIDINDFSVDEIEGQKSSVKDDGRDGTHQSMAVEDIFEESSLGEKYQEENKNEPHDHDQPDKTAGDDMDAEEGEEEKKEKEESQREEKHLMSGLRKRGVHVGEVNPDFHATPPNRQKQEEQVRKLKEEKQREEQELAEETEKKRKQEEQKKDQVERERLEREEREKEQREMQETARKEQEKIVEEQKVAQQKKDEELKQQQQEVEIRQQKQNEVERKKEESESIEGEVQNSNAVNDIFDSFTSDRGQSKIEPIERSQPPLETPSSTKVHSIPSPHIPVAPQSSPQESSSVKNNVVSGELPLLEAIDQFWKSPSHAKAANTRDFIVDVEKFANQYFSHFADEKMRIMYGWQTLRESASESFHVSPTFSECESKFGPKALNQYIHSLPNR